MAVFNTISTFYRTSETTPRDINQPYTYQEWKVRNPNVVSGDAIALYNNYVKSWYTVKTTTNLEAVNYIKEKYKVFLQTLGFSPRTEQEKNFFDAVDIQDDLSLQSAIAGYAKRLKDISVYIASRRSLVSYSKLKNNLTGTSVSLERLFYFYILNSFTRKNTPDGSVLVNFLDPSIISSVPVLEDITDQFKIEIEELYDTSNYFDKDPSVSIDTYTTMVSSVPASLYESGSYSLTQETAELIFDTALVDTITQLVTTAMNTNYFTYTGDGFTTTFQLNGVTSSQASDYQVSVDGIVQTPDSVYTVSAINQSITFVEAPEPTTIIVVIKRY